MKVGKHLTPTIWVCSELFPSKICGRSKKGGLRDSMHVPSFKSFPSIYVKLKVVSHAIFLLPSLGPDVH